MSNGGWSRLSRRIHHAWASIGNSLWFLPSLIALCGGVAAIVLINVDRHFDPEAAGAASIVFQGGPEGARAVLSAIASSMMTVTGVTFSITVVALTLASQQYTPRILGHFMADRGNQWVLGTFIATFIYSLLVLRTVRADSAGLFVPNVAVTVGVALAVVSLALLIYFIHHTASMIQPSAIIERVATTTGELIDRLFPEPLGDGTDAPAAEALRAELPTGAPATVSSHSDGYLQAIDLDALMALATRERLVIRLEISIGEYALCGAPLATLWCESSDPNEVDRELHDCFTLGRSRTLEQDAPYGILQLSDIGVKALSPGINDPTTAITCIDALGSLVLRFGRRQIPSPYRIDDAGVLRVIASGPDFAQVASLAFDSIRHYGERDPEVMLRLAHTLGRVARALQSTPAHRDVIGGHLEGIRACASRAIQDGEKLRKVEEAVCEAFRDASLPNRACKTVTPPVHRAA